VAVTVSVAVATEVWTVTMPTVNVPLSDLRSDRRQLNLAFIAKLRRDSEIHSCLRAGVR
jgi:hypothetical protein